MLVLTVIEFINRVNKLYNESGNCQTVLFFLVNKVVGLKK